ncbi:MAG: OmpA family protein [Alphaproteobacteria bacterium]|nr:OmpA family protein [Alphaproteobacteria bacterium]
MMKLSRLVAVGAFVGLAGCGLGGTFHVDSFIDQEIAGDDFVANLAKEYQRRTKVERDVDYEWRHAGRLAQKGMAAAAGERVQPWDPADWNVAPEDMGDLQAARTRLMTALNSDAPTYEPVYCAQAQVYYDGWLEQANDNDFGPGFVGPVQPNYVAAERAAFEEVMPKCEGLTKPVDFTIYFGWDRFDLTAEANRVIGEIVNFVGGLGRKPNVGVAGHTDTSGSARYNEKLACKRSDAVSGALKSGGVNVTSTECFGETRPAVPTGDGVREPLNRRAVVTLSR